MSHRMVNGSHTGIIFYAGDRTIRTKWWRAVEPMEGKSGLGLSKREMSPHLLICCCQTAVLEKTVCFYRERKGKMYWEIKMTAETQELYILFGAQLYSDIYVSHTWGNIDACAYIHMWDICISKCTFVYPSLLFSSRINMLNPKKIFGIQIPLILKTSAHPYHSIN